VDEIKAVGRFAIHAVVGVAIFAIVAGAAVLLNKFNEYVLEQHVPSYISFTLPLIEFLTFAVDTILFVVFILKEAYVLLRKILF